MKIIKKDGRLEEFKRNKIEVSLSNAARDANAMLNESDLYIIVKDIVDRINYIRKDGSSTSSYEIIGVIIKVLSDDSFSDVLTAYTKFFISK